MDYNILSNEINQSQYAGMSDAEIADALNAPGASTRRRVPIAELQARAMETGVYTALRVVVGNAQAPTELRAVAQTVLDLASARFADVDLDSAAAQQMFGALQQARVITPDQAAQIDALADVVTPSWARVYLGRDVTEGDLASARLWVESDTLRRRLAAGYNAAVTLLDTGISGGALPSWAELVAAVEAA